MKTCKRQDFVQMCLILMHSEILEDHDLCFKSLQELEEWSREEGLEDWVKTAGQFQKFEISHKD